MPRFAYGDPTAALVTRQAKHEPGPSAVVHAARRVDSKTPLALYAERWGQVGTPAEEHEQDPRGYSSTLRGFYTPSQESIDVQPSADATATLAHEMGHYLLSHAGRVGGEREEALADYMAGQHDAFADRVPDQGVRQGLREYAVHLLGPDISREAGPEELGEPSAVDRLNEQKATERHAMWPWMKPSTRPK